MESDLLGVTEMNQETKKLLCLKTLLNQVLPSFLPPYED